MADNRGVEQSRQDVSAVESHNKSSGRRIQSGAMFFRIQPANSSSLKEPDATDSMTKVACA
ncbi:MAG: hypothetical protein WDM81_16590 [Rhizomicrobium sp.]